MSGQQDEHEDLGEDPEDVSEYDRLSKRIDELFTLLDFIGDFKAAFDKHSRDFEEQSSEWEDFMDETNTEIAAIKAELKDAKETSKKQDFELMNAIKVLSKTFDKETYDRFTQSEEIRQKFDELQRMKEEVRGEATFSQQRNDNMMELINGLKHTLDVQQKEMLNSDDELKTSIANIEQIRSEFESGFEFHRKETMELLTAVDILSKTFDNESYERSVQGEEVNRWIEDAKQAVKSIEGECEKQRDASGHLLGAIDQLKIAIDREEKERVDLGMQVDTLRDFKREIDRAHALREEEKRSLTSMVKDLHSSYDVETMERIRHAEKVMEYIDDNKNMLETVRKECITESEGMNELLGAIQSMKTSLETEVKERLADNDHVVRMLEESSIAMKDKGIAITSSLDRLKNSLALPRTVTDVKKSMGPISTAPQPVEEVLTRYKVDGSKIPQHIARNAGGLAYRKSARLDDKSAYNVAPWDSYVWGKQEGDFVKVGSRYLPMHLHGECVLIVAGREDADFNEDDQLKEDGQPLRADERIMETSRKVRNAARRIKKIQARGDVVPSLSTDDTPTAEPEAETAPDAASAELQRAVNHLQTQFAHERSERMLLFTEVVSLRDTMVPKIQAIEKGSGLSTNSIPISASSIYEKSQEDNQRKREFVELSKTVRMYEERMNDMESFFQNRFESLHKDISDGVMPQAFAPDTVIEKEVKDPEVDRRLDSIESQIAAMAVKQEHTASLLDVMSQVQGHESKINSMMDQIKMQVSRLDQLSGRSLDAGSEKVKAEVEMAMRNQQPRFEAIAQQQAELKGKLDQLGSFADMDNRLKQLGAEVQAMARFRGRIDELADQQGSAKRSFLDQLSDAKMAHDEKLSKATSSLRNELQDLIKSQVSASDINASIAEIRAQVVAIVTSEPVTRDEFQEQLSGMYQSLAERGGGDAAAESISKKDFESNNRNVWEAIMQLQIKQLEESKQKAREQFDSLTEQRSLRAAPAAAAPRTVVGQVLTQQQPGLLPLNYNTSTPNLAAAYQMAPPASPRQASPARSAYPLPGSPQRVSSPAPVQRVLPAKTNSFENSVRPVSNGFTAYSGAAS